MEDKIVFNFRPALEIILQKDSLDEQELDNQINWLALNATSIHIEEDEFFLSLPDYGDHEKIIEKMYQNIPERIKTLLLAAIKVSNEKNLKNGYLLLVYI